MPFTGVFAPLPTPFDEQDRVDTARLRAAFPRWLASRLAGFVMLGSSGEAVLLDEDESDRVVAAARELVPRGRPLVAGVGRESTQATVRAARRAAALGADAVIVRTPGFYKPQMDEDAFVRHYTAVADASPVPILLYNFTAATGVTLPAAAVSRLAAHPNIAGMKESGSDTARVAALVSAAPPPFSILAGSSSTFFEALSAGAAGGILALASVLPDACVRLFDLARQQRADEAAALQRQLAPVSRLIGPVYGIAGLKAALRLAGCDVGLPRPPLAPVSADGIAVLQEALAAFQDVAA